jgi:hypothetical protein
MAETETITLELLEENNWVTWSVRWMFYLKNKGIWKLVGRRNGTVPLFVKQPCVAL